MENQILSFINLIEFRIVCNNTNEDNLNSNDITLYISPSKLRIKLIDYCIKLININDFKSYEDLFNNLCFKSHYKDSSLLLEIDKDDVSKKWKDKVISKSDLNIMNNNDINAINTSKESEAEKRILGKASKEDSINTILELLEFTYYYAFNYNTSKNQINNITAVNSLINNSCTNFDKLFKDKIKLTSFYIDNNVNNDEDNTNNITDKITITLKRQTDNIKDLNNKILTKLNKINNKDINYTNTDNETTNLIKNNCILMNKEIATFYDIYKKEFEIYVKSIDNNKVLNDIELNMYNFIRVKNSYDKYINKISEFFSYVEKINNIKDT